MNTLLATALLLSTTCAYAESETLREDLQPTLLASASSTAPSTAYTVTIA